MKRSFDIDKAMEVSNVSNYENNDIILKACGKMIQVSFRKAELQGEMPTFSVRSGTYSDDLAVDVFGYNGEMLALEPGHARSVAIGIVTPAMQKKQELEEEQKSAQACCQKCGGSGVLWEENLIFCCHKCAKFDSDIEARAFVKKVFQTVIRNGGGE